MSKIQSVLASLIVALAVSAVASATASAVMPAFTDSAGHLLVGRLSLLTKKLGGNAILKGTLAGIKIEIQCTEEHGTGWIENSATTGTGLGLGTLHYLSCTFKKAPGKGCVVNNSLVLVKLFHGSLVLGTAGIDRYLARFTPDEGTVFTKLNVVSCENVSLDQEYPIEGSVQAFANNSTLTLQFTEESGSFLTFGGNSATYTDEVTVEMLGGGGFRIEDGS